MAVCELRFRQLRHRGVSETPRLLVRRFNVFQITHSLSSIAYPWREIARHVSAAC